MKISLFGYGKTTKAIAKKIDKEAIFYDDNVEKEYIDSEGFLIKPSSSFNPNYSNLEILTPSINPSNPLLKLAKNPISEYDLFLSDSAKELREKLNLPKNPPYSIWISGTNGKTTTTQMLTHLLSDRGAISGGNIGTPLANMDSTAAIWILETSSYTLHHTKEASPGVYILLPITPDHLMWHGSKEAYIKDKLSVISRMQEGELALIPAGLPIPDTNAWIVEYKDSYDLAKFFEIDIDKINFKAAFLLDALLALAVTRTLFDEVDYTKINSFKLDRHRQEEIRDYLDRVWINDSKATNIDATIQALKGFEDKRVHLIIGGDDKGVDMSQLIKSLKKFNIASIYTIGSNSQKLYNMAKEQSIPAIKCDRLENAVKEIDKNLKKDEIALLSPACASLDQFSSYAQRGDIFIETIRNLSVN